jgi:hypothetical protein
MTLRRLFLALSTWVAFGLVCLPGGKAKADISVDNVKELIRVATCADVRAVVAAAGLAKTEAIARAAGATEEQIARARRCLR